MSESSVGSRRNGFCSLKSWLKLVLQGLAVAGYFYFAGPSRGQEGQAKAPQATGPFSLPDPYALPDPKRLFRLDTEKTLRERMTRDSELGENPLGLKYKINFPDYPATPTPGLIVRQWPPLVEVVDPHFVCYRRLYFEQLNMERYGRDFGIWSPLISQGAFYRDLLMLPYNAATEPFRRYECNSGYYLPGDAAPLLLYRPEWSWTGAAAQAAFIGLGFVVFP